MQLISNWLNGAKNFIVGRAIYNSLGSDENLKNLFSKGENPYNKKRLEEAMQALLVQPQKPIAIKVSVATQTKVATEFEVGNDRILQQLKDEWLPLYIKMNYCRYELDKYRGLKDEASTEARGKLALEILDFEEKVNEIWQRADYYRVHKVLPHQVQREGVWDVPTNPKELKKVIANCKRNIRRNAQLIKLHPSNLDYPIYYKQYMDYHVKLTGKAYVFAN